jgi:hypothetical protein
MKDVLNWADSRVLVRYGKGTKDGSATLETKSKVGMIRIGRLWTGGDMHVTFESFDRFETLIPVEQRAQIEARAKRLPVACSTIAKTGVIREYIDVLQSLLDAVTKEQIPESTPHR